MIRALLRRLFGRDYPEGGELGALYTDGDDNTPSSGELWAELNEYERPDTEDEATDPILRLVREARAVGATTAWTFQGATQECGTCGNHTRRPVYAFVTKPGDAFQIGTQCPNCLPQEDHE